MSDVLAKLATWVGWMAGLAVGAAGCGATPLPLNPALRGSVGLPHHGVLSDGVALPARGPGFERLRRDGVGYGSRALVQLLTHAASVVHESDPRSPPLVIADLSEAHGGPTARHRSHRTGRDADLLLFSITPDGRPVKTPGFVHFGHDGLAPARIDGKKTYLRLDVPRQWALVKALIEAPRVAAPSSQSSAPGLSSASQLSSGGHASARADAAATQNDLAHVEVQWLFVAAWVENKLIEHALARGEPLELVYRAAVVLHQPSDSLSHDDHIHLRLACSPDDEVAGCRGGPRWPWIAPPHAHEDDDETLIRAICEPLCEEKSSDDPGDAGPAEPACQREPA